MTKLSPSAARKLLIDGKWQDSVSKRSFKAFSPSDGRLLGTLALAGEDDVDLAAAAAQKSLSGSWGQLTPAKKERLLRRLGHLIEENADELAELESTENGKPIWHTKAIDAPVAARLTYSAAGWPSKIAGYTPNVSIPNQLVYTQREPVGVVAVIIPWNYPLIHTMQKVAPALACGNAVILKPAEQASLATLRLAELIQEAGLPDGVFNILTGDGPTTGAAIANHPGIDKIAFTGSVAAGKSVMCAASRNIKRMTLELGNKAANIIFPDADLSKAVSGAFKAAFGNSGQSCVAGARLFIHQEVYEDVLEQLIARAQTVKVGHALDPQTKFGPIIDQQQLESILRYIRSGLDQGATLEYGGERLWDNGLDKGFFIQPTMFTGVTDDMIIACEEIFGPVVSIFRFNDEDEVIARANDTPYGLAAGIWTRDVALAHRVSAALKSGVVWVNNYDLFDAAAPFGGFKGSGFGRDNGREVIDAFTEVKTVWVNTEL
ncbi:MAG: aldehyde dehydrogenase family protein [Candidatus Promineifilaceae bacterium]|nr:aldehyde dehydrogenase family protein [Candidatus Promineifilaceae bacterium]